MCGPAYDSLNVLQSGEFMPRAVDAGDEDAAYLALLAAKRKSLAMGDDDDQNTILMDEWTDDEEIETALDDVDVFSMLVAAMNNMQDVEPQRFQVTCPVSTTSQVLL